MKTTKRKNPNDTTFRNIDALKRKLMLLWAAHCSLVVRVDALERLALKGKR